MNTFNNALDTAGKISMPVYNTWTKGADIVGGGIANAMQGLGAIKNRIAQRMQPRKQAKPMAPLTNTQRPTVMDSFTDHYNQIKNFQ